MHSCLFSKYLKQQIFWVGIGIGVPRTSVNSNFRLVCTHLWTGGAGVNISNAFPSCSEHGTPPGGGGRSRFRRHHVDDVRRGVPAQQGGRPLPGPRDQARTQGRMRRHRLARQVQHQTQFHSDKIFLPRSVQETLKNLNLQEFLSFINTTVSSIPHHHSDVGWSPRVGGRGFAVQMA